MEFMVVSVLWLFLFACQKEEPQPPSSGESTLEENPLVFSWITRLPNTDGAGNHSQGVLYGDWFIYPGELGKAPRLIAFDKTTGEVAWNVAFNQYPGDDIGFGFRMGQIYVAKTRKRLLGIRLDDQSLSWEYSFQDNNLLGTGKPTIGSNAKVYITAVMGLWTDFHQEFLLEFDPLTGQSRTVIRYDPDSLGAKAIGPPVLTDGPAGRQVAIFNLAHFTYAGPQESPQEIRAIDLETGETLWSSPVIDSFPSNLLHPPVVFEDLVITGGGWSMYAFNKYTGEPVWTYAFDYPWGVWTKTNHLVHQDRLYVNNSQFDVTCLDPRSGELIWNNSKGGPNSCESMTYYEKEDLLVFSSWGYGSVMVLDALTGRTIHREKALEGASFYKDVLYDEELDMFFTASFKHAFGFTIQRPD